MLYVAISITLTLILTTLIFADLYLVQWALKMLKGKS